MRSTHVLVGILALCSALAAQDPQLFSIWPNSRGFASRGLLGSSDGETLQGFHAAFHRGIGEVSQESTIIGLTAICQDEDASTAESFDWIVRHGDDITGPSRSAADLVAKISGVKTPVAVGQVSWRLTSSFSAPLKLQDCSRHFAVGIGLPAANYPADGLTTHAETQAKQFSHSRQEEHAWDFVGSATVAQHPSHRRTYNYGVLVPGVVLQMGNGGNRFGMGGMFPNTGEPLVARVLGGASMANAVGFVVLSTKQVRISGISLGSAARVYISPSYHFFPLQANAAGAASANLLTAVPASVAGLGRFNFQALYDKNGSVFFSNAWTVVP